MEAPLSKTIILNSAGFCNESSSKNIWKVSPLQPGISRRNLSPLIGEKALNR